ncbi:exodeoxyribonuclease VII large subunit [Candidatus Saccharibacteria bacterium]|nr:exodeoxyribonuclease VII large subunit [Candidatus Saccharibacteria bacterium]MCL1962774.1 exodeoxyribonuclease VII large subunit [Candidatus Saccharibacteria bacterium]
MPVFEVSDAVAIFNQILETATPAVAVVGEVANFKINQNKWVFFDIKDAESTLNCFMSVFNLHGVIEDGMRVEVLARPQITKWGKFSLTIQNVRPVGAGSIKRAFELLRAKLDAEGLFAIERKRTLPELPDRIGVISSTDAAGYADFIKILNERMSGISIEVAHVQVQGDAAPEQIIAALKYFNEQKNPPEVIAILRGGGSRDDLMAFDDERLVREIAASRVPIITGIGHEIDTTLTDLAADVRAATPSNAVQILVPDRREIISTLDFQLSNLINESETRLNEIETRVVDNCSRMPERIDHALSEIEYKLKFLNAALQQLNPRTILRRGYAIVRGQNGKVLRTAAVGETLIIENYDSEITATVEKISRKT